MLLGPTCGDLCSYLDEYHDPVRYIPPEVDHLTKTLPCLPSASSAFTPVIRAPPPKNDDDGDDGGNSRGYIKVTIVHRTQLCSVCCIVYLAIAALFRRMNNSVPVVVLRVNTVEQNRLSRH